MLRWRRQRLQQALGQPADHDRVRLCIENCERGPSSAVGEHLPAVANLMPDDIGDRAATLVGTATARATFNNSTWAVTLAER